MTATTVSNGCGSDAYAQVTLRSLKTVDVTHDVTRSTLRLVHHSHSSTITVIGWLEKENASGRKNYVKPIVFHCGTPRAVMALEATCCRDARQRCSIPNSSNRKKQLTSVRQKTWHYTPPTYHCNVRRRHVCSAWEIARLALKCS